MKTVKIGLDEDLVQAMDCIAKALRISRSAFAREALREALAQVEARGLEQRHRVGYARCPVRQGEFDRWESEQVWVEP